MARPIFRINSKRIRFIRLNTQQFLRKKRIRHLSQVGTLRKLLVKASETEFGRSFGFAEILSDPNLQDAFAKRVPVVDYDGMHIWWRRAEQGHADVAWPGKVKYFALSSGTSGAPSKHIPVTKALLRSTRKTSIRQLVALRNFGIQPVSLRTKVLTLSGSTSLQDFGIHQKGDVSGINVKNLPWFARTLHKPGQKIAAAPDWESRLAMMVEKAPSWDIGIVAGVPAWLDILLTRIRETYDLDHIHQLWPHFNAFIHGGVSITPYRSKLESHFGKPVVFAETYLASEGFFAYQSNPDSTGMELVRKAGIYFEFIPFTESHFDEDGGLLNPFPESFDLSKVELDKPYALVISTCAGAWRYLIGDVVRFVSLDPPEIIIDGRTKHFLSLCGEHLSVDNMNHALAQVGSELGLHLQEFGVAGITKGKSFGHHWYVACDTSGVDPEKVKIRLDEALKSLNDDYAVERQHALSHLEVTLMPGNLFIDFLASQGRAGGQSKFPRVLKGQVLDSWLEFLRDEGV